jgi:hypothetical protein
MNSSLVYVVQHSYQRDDDADETKIIGVFSDESKGKLAVERCKALPGFKEHTNGFYIDKYYFDRCMWENGFDPSSD